MKPELQRQTGPWSRLLPAGIGALMLGCIIPDNNIEVVDVKNPNPVRIVREWPVELSGVDAACDALSERVDFCPQPPRLPRGLASGYLDPETNPEFEMCICDKAAGERDTGLRPFTLYAEDADFDDDGEPKDELRAAFVLDRHKAPSSVVESVQYAQYLGSPSELPQNAPIGRPAPFLWQFPVGLTVGGTQFVDLCNGNAGTDSLTDGTHVLEFLVTDREWFTPELCPSDPGSTSTAATASGECFETDPLVGIPDLAAGASHDTATFVFKCIDEPRCEDQCVLPEESQD